MKNPAFAALVLAVAGCRAEAEDESAPEKIHARLADCRLVAGSTEIAPLRFGPVTGHTLEFGTHRVVVDGREIRELKDGQKDPVWTADVDSDQKAWILAGEKDRAYVISYEETENGYFSRYDPEGRIRVLDLSNGKWRDPLQPGSGDGTLKRLQVTAISCHDDRVAVISLWGKEAEGKDGKPSASHYQVDLFALDKSNPLWSRRFPLDAVREYDGAYVFGIPGPRYASSDLQSITWMGDDLLVCAEARQPLQLLSAFSGREIWSVDRIWEFQRGYVGPSCYSYFIGRFGKERFGREAGVDADKEDREEFDKRWRASILGGPVVVPLPFERGGDAYSIFVAVLLAPADGPSYLADCVVFEFNDLGEPVSIGKVPQVVDGGTFAASDGGVLWRGFNDSFVRVAAARRKCVVQMGGGGPDGTARIEWFRQISVAPHAAWFASPPAGDSVALAERSAFSVAEGGFVRSRDAGVYTFPIAVTSMKDGSTDSILLQVPFDGEFPLPSTNFHVEGGTRQTFEPYLMAVTGLATHGSNLRVTLGREKVADVLEFDLSALPHSAAGAAAGDEAARIAEAQRRVKALKDLNADDAEGSTPLESAAASDDLPMAAALLKAGADPERKGAKYTWTAVRSAAVYGSPEMVELLLRGGAKSPPGALWVSGKQPARKMKAFLDAGADPNGADEDGRTTLMIAAGCGQLTCVELLLARGARPDAKAKDGRTALDSVRDGNTSIKEALEEALKKK